MMEKPSPTTRTHNSKKDYQVSRVRKTESSQPVRTPSKCVLSLQRTVGKQAVQRMIKSGIFQAKLKIGTNAFSTRAGGLTVGIMKNGRCV